MHLDGRRLNKLTGAIFPRPINGHQFQLEVPFQIPREFQLGLKLRTVADSHGRAVAEHCIRMRTACQNGAHGALPVAQWHARNIWSWNKICVSILVKSVILFVHRVLCFSDLDLYILYHIHEKGLRIATVHVSEGQELGSRRNHRVSYKERFVRDVLFLLRLTMTCIRNSHRGRFNMFTRISVILNS